MAQILFNKAFKRSNLPNNRNELIDHVLKNSHLHNLILIVPTARLARTIKRKIVDDFFELYNKPCPKLNVIKFNQLVQKVFSQIFVNNSALQISEPFALTLLSKAVQNSELKFFKQKSDTLSNVVTQKLANIVLGLKADGIKISDIKHDIDHQENDDIGITNINRLKDIYELYLEYEKLLGSEYIDSPGILLKLLNEFEAMDSSETLFEDENKNDNVMKELDKIFGNDSILFFDGFTEFRKPELEFINHFSQTGFPVGLKLDYSHINGPLFSNLKQTMIRLIEVGFNVKDTADLYVDSHELHNTEYLRRWLFNTEMEIKHPNIASMIEIRSCSTKVNEIKYISKYVKFQIIDGNYTPKDICIVTRKPQEYSRILREYFALYNIPINVSDRFRLDQSPIVIAVFSLINVITKGYKREDINSVLRNRYLDFGEKIDVNNFYETALNLRIRGGNSKGGKDSWLKRFNSAISNFKSIINNRQYDSTSDDNEIRYLNYQLKSIESAKSDLEQLVRIVPDNLKSSNPSEIADFIVKNIIDKFKIRNNIESYYNHLNDQLPDLKKIQIKEDYEKDARAFSMFLNIINETVYILETISKDKNFALSEFADILKIAVSNAKYQIREKNDFGVTVTSIEQTRGVQYKLLILAGAVDKVFPLTYTPERFLGKELPDSEQRHNASEKMLFYQFLTNSPESFNSNKQKLMITYPMKENELELVRSPFVDAIIKITDDEDTLVRHISDDEIDSIIANYGELTANIENANDIVIQIPEILIDEQKESQILSGELLSKDNIDKFGEIANRNFSVSSLENYAKCPFRYFTSNVLRLKEYKDYDDKLSYLERGNLFHIIAYRFYSELAASSDNVLKRIKADSELLPDIIAIKLDSSIKEIYIQRILEIAEEEFKAYSFVHYNFEFEKNLMMGTAEQVGLLELWLDDELGRMENETWNYYPCLFEFSFGNQKEGILSPINLTENLTLRGKIDRIDIDPENNRIFIGDYKRSSNSIPSFKDIEEGKSFQIPLYSIAMKEFLMKHYSNDIEISGGIYYFYTPLTKKDNLGNSSVLLNNQEHYPSKNNPLENREQLQEVLTNTLSKADNLIERLHEGNIEITDDIENCKYCTFGNICRINERQ